MSLGNLTINVIANTAPTVAGLRDVGATAHQAFTQSGAAADDFRAHLTQASDHLASAAKQMGSSMEAANDAIAASSAQSEAAVQHLVDTTNKADFSTFSERAAHAFGVGVGAGVVAAQTWVEKYAEYIETKAKYIAIGLAIAAVSATAGVVYGAYRLISGSLGFIEGLFTGESYKSASIDELIALNNQVKELQNNLHISAQEAGALLDATSRLGVKPSDYSAAYNAADVAMRNNGDELDRLGVKYKDSEGHLLKQQEFLGNVKRALDEYTVGWDRNQAAAAMGFSSYEQIVAALKITETELVASKDRLDEYGLGFGPERQAAVAAYEQAMRNFKNEMKLTSQGFSGAIADQIMPAFTRLSDMFKDGWPFLVRVTRYGMAEITSMLYGLVTVADLIVDAYKGSLLAVHALVTGSANAAALLLKGDFSGASKAFSDGWAGAGTAVHLTWQEMVADATRNRDAMVLAWGLDDRTDSLAVARDKNKDGGKKWTPKPKPEDTPKPAPASAYQNYLDDLDRTITKLQQNEYASMRLKAEQLAQKEGITDLAAAYDKINAIQRGESQRAVDEMVRKLGEESAAYGFQTSLLGLTALEQDKLTFAMQKRLELEQAIAAAKRAGKPLDDQAVSDLRRQIDATIALGQAQRDERDAIARSASTGVQNALNAYRDTASNTAKAAESAITGSLTRLEDALLHFTQTGKLNLGSLWQFMADEFLRQFIRMQIAQAAGAGSSSLLGLIGMGVSAMFGGTVVGSTGNYNALDGAAHLATGTNYVPYDGMPAILHKGEAVVPAAYNPANGGSGGAGGGGGMVVHQNFNIQGGADARTQQQLAAAAARGLQIAQARNN